MKTLPLASNKWPELFRRVELFFKNIVCPKGKNFWCDSKDFRICYICGALRYMMRRQVIFNPKNYVWKIYTKDRFYVISKHGVQSFPASMILKRKCPELTPR